MSAEPETAACPECGAEQRVNKDGTIRKHKADPSAPVPCKGGGQPVGEHRIPRPSNPGYYKDPATRLLLRRVTTILNLGSPKPKLVQWSGDITAETAIDNLPALVRASRDPGKRAEAYDWLRMTNVRRRDERRDVGTAVHQLIEARVLGTQAPDDVLSNPEMAPYLEHFHAFVDEWQVTFEASEMVVANYARGYAGTLDFLLRSPLLADQLGAPADAVLMGDTKTGGELDVKGVYPEAALQMSAYRNAEYGWLRNGDKIPLPDVHDLAIVLHLRPEGYRVIPVRCGSEVFEAFGHICKVAEFHSGLAANVLGAALTLPSSTSGKAA